MGEGNGEGARIARQRETDAKTESAGDDIRHAPRPRVMRGKSEGWGGGVNPDSFFFF